MSPGHLLLVSSSGVRRIPRRCSDAGGDGRGGGDGGDGGGGGGGGRGGRGGSRAGFVLGCDRAVDRGAVILADQSRASIALELIS